MEIPSPKELSEKLIKKFPIRYQSRIRSFLNLIGWILAVESTIKIVLDRGFVRDGFLFIAAQLPSFYKEFIEPVLTLIDVLSEVWRDLFHYPIIYIFSLVGISIPSGFIDIIRFR